MAGWHHQRKEHELGQTPGNSEGQGGLSCCSPWGHRVRQHWVTEQQQKCPCIFCCWEFLSWKAIDFVKCFCICWYDHVVILSFILLMWCITLIDFHMLNYPGLVTLHHIYGIFKVPLSLVSKYFIIYYYYYYF